MARNWPLSKDELYGPPPAYSLTNSHENSSTPPPCYTPSIYVLPIRERSYQERSSSHQTLIILSKKMIRYLLGTGLVHMIVGLATIVCDVILTIMNESYSFTGLWTGALNILLGIYLILYMTHPEKRIYSLKRLQFLHMVMCLISIVALILSSINLASDSCYKIFLGPDRCQHSAYLIKIILVTLFALTFIQICTTIGMTFIHAKKSRLVVRRNGDRTSEING